MKGDKLDALGPALNEIGVEMANVAGGATTGLYLYVEAGQGWVGTSLFKNETNHIRYIDVPKSSSLDDLIFDARETEPDKTKRWSIMEYVIENQKFHVSFKFSDEFDVESEADLIGRSNRFLKARYGDKPIVYPERKDAFELEREGK